LGMEAKAGTDAHKMDRDREDASGADLDVK
jgi:hypothetical protein